MAKKLQLRRGTTAQHNSFTGDVGECTVDTDKDTLVVHDNSTQGGFPLAREDLNNVSALPTTITATTQTAGNNTTRVATTAFVTTAIGNISTESISSGTSNVTVTNDAQTTITANNVEAAEFGTAEVVFNDTGADRDFRVESDDNANMLFVDGGEDRVGIGTNTPQETLEVNGNARLEGVVLLRSGNNIAFNNSGNTRSVRLDAADSTENYTATLPPTAPTANGEVMAIASGTTDAELEWTKPWRVPVQSTAPTGAVQGDLWWDTDDARLYIYISDTNIVNEAAWVAASPV